MSFFKIKIKKDGSFSYKLKGDPREIFEHIRAIEKLENLKVVDDPQIKEMIYNGQI